MIGDEMTQVRIRTNLERGAAGSADSAPVAAMARGVTGLWLAATGGLAATLLTWTALELASSGGLWRIDDVVAVAVNAVGALVAAWYALTGAAVTLGALTRRGLGISRWGAPLARRLGMGLAAAAVGAGVIPGAAWAAVPDDLTVGGLVTITVEDSGSGLGAGNPGGADMVEIDARAGNGELEAGSGAGTEGAGTEGAAASQEANTAEVATVPPVAPVAESTADGAAVREATPAVVPAGGTHAGEAPVREVGSAVVPAGEPSAARDRDTQPTHALGAAEAYVVEAGDCLWWIAEEELPDDAGNARIAARVEQWVDANPELRANPDLIVTGQRLAVPGSAS
nr:hypothetical protein [Actinomycetales bacterium]